MLGVGRGSNATLVLSVMWRKGVVRGVCTTGHSICARGGNPLNFGTHLKTWRNASCSASRKGKSPAPCRIGRNTRI